MITLDIFFAILLIVDSMAIGKAIMNRILFRYVEIGRLTVLYLSAFFGLGVLMYFSFFLGLAGGYYRYIVTPIVIVGSIVILTWRYHDLKQTFKAACSSVWSKYDTKIGKSILICLGALFTFLIIYSFVPPRDCDALSYNLEIPRQYAINHKIHALPGHSFAQYFPMNGSYLVVLSYILGDGYRVSHILYSFITILFLVGIGIFYYKLFKEPLGAIAIQFIIPLLPLFETVYFYKPEFLMAGYGIGVLILLSSLQGKDACCASLHIWLSMGILNGFGLSIKPTYIFIFSFTAVMAIISYFLRHKSDHIKIHIRCFILFACVPILFLVPWMIYNLSITGNPIFPFLYPYLGGRPWNISIWHMYKDFFPNTLYMAKDISEVIDVLYRNLSLMPATGLSESFSPVSLLFIIPFGGLIFFLRGYRESKYMFVLGLVLLFINPLIFVLDSYRKICWLIAIILFPLIYLIIRFFDKYTNKVICSLLILLPLIGLSFFRFMPLVHDLQYGFKDNNESCFAPPIYAYINEHLSQDNKLLCHDTLNAGFFVRIPYIYSHPFTNNRGLLLSKDPAQFIETIRGLGVTHVLACPGNCDFLLRKRRVLIRDYYDNFIYIYDSLLASGVFIPIKRDGAFTLCRVNYPIKFDQWLDSSKDISTRLLDFSPRLVHIKGDSDRQEDVTLWIRHKNAYSSTKVIIGEKVIDAIYHSSDMLSATLPPIIFKDGQEYEIYLVDDVVGRRSNPLYIAFVSDNPSAKRLELIGYEYDLSSNDNASVMKLICNNGDLSTRVEINGREMDTVLISSRLLYAILPTELFYEPGELEVTLIDTRTNMRSNTIRIVIEDRKNRRE